MKKYIGKFLITVFILSIIVIVIHIRTMIHGGGLLMSANHETELGIVELQIISLSTST